MIELVLASALILAAPDVTLSSAEASVPMDHSTGHAAVMVHVNGQGPYLFQVDTYASGLMYVDDDFAKELGLEKVGTVRNSDGHTVREVDQVSLGDVHVGELKIDNVRATVLDFDWIARADGKRVHGLIGFACFAKLTVTYDYPGNRMVFSKRRLKRELSNTLPFSTRATGSPDIKLTLGDRELVFGIDTGSDGALTIDLADSDELPFLNKLKKAGKATTVYRSYDVYRGVLAVPFDLAGHAVNYLTMTVIENGGKGMVGYRLLSSYKVSFDQRSRLMRLERPALPEFAALSDQERTAWVGTYALGKEQFGIEHTEGELFFRVGDNPPLRAVPVSADELIFASGPGRLFLRADSEGANGLGIQALPMEPVREAQRIEGD